MKKYLTPNGVRTSRTRIAGVVTLRYRSQFNVDAFGEADFECPVCGLDAGDVAVEDEDDFFCVSFQDSCVARCEACTECGDDVFAAVLVCHHAVGVAFDDDGGA